MRQQIKETVTITNPSEECLIAVGNIIMEQNQSQSTNDNQCIDMMLGDVLIKDFDFILSVGYGELDILGKSSEITIEYYRYIEE